ncbi:MAG: hypothetical protein ABI364_07610 [Caldimonas sp.]
MKRLGVIAFPTLAAALAIAATSLPASAADAPAPPNLSALPAPAASPRSAAAAVPATAASAAPLVETAEAAPRTPEPAVQRTVIEDKGMRIEELRVRGQLKKVTVDLKGHAPNYEILLGDGSHVIADDPGTSRGSAGKRVWNVLRF